MFTVLLAVAGTLLQLYVFRRAASLPRVARLAARRVRLGVALGLWAAYVLGVAAIRWPPGPAATALERWSLSWLGVLFLLSVALLVADALTGFGRLWPRAVAPARTAALLAGALLSAVAFVQGLRAPVVQRYDVGIDGLPAALDGTVVVALSDLHMGSLLGPRWLAARVAQVQAERPDLVVLLGDVFEGHAAPAPALERELAALRAPLGVWGVIGNHERYSGSAGAQAAFARSGIRLLRNAWAEPRPGLVLAGVDDVAEGRGDGRTVAALRAALAGRPQRAATILLVHAPLPPAQVAAAGVDLMLSGHTHGGQLWPFGLAVRQVFPLFVGRYRIGTTTVIVSRGTGTWGPRMRLWHPAEIVRVTLHARPAANDVVARVGARR
jgi:uncharacterized protein